MPNFASRNVPPRFTSIVCRQTSSDVSGADAACITPALAYRTFTAPNRSSAAAIGRARRRTGSRRTPPRGPRRRRARSRRRPPCPRPRAATRRRPWRPPRNGRRPPTETGGRPRDHRDLAGQAPGPVPVATAGLARDGAVGGGERLIDGREALRELSSSMQSTVASRTASGPWCRRRPTDRSSAFISSLLPLNGAIGSRLRRSRISSRIPNSPMFRTAPTLGWRSASSAWWRPITSPIFARSRSGRPPRTRGSWREPRRTPAGASCRSTHRSTRWSRSARNVRAHRHTAQRDVARREALGDRHDVRHDVPVIHGEPLAVRPKPAMIHRRSTGSRAGRTARECPGGGRRAGSGCRWSR